MTDTQRYLARVRPLALVAMTTGEGKPLAVADRLSPPQEKQASDVQSPARIAADAVSRLPFRAKDCPASPPRPAGVAGVGLSPAERRRLAHLSPAAIAAVDRVVAKLGDGTAEPRHAASPGAGQVHFRRRQETLAGIRVLKSGTLAAAAQG